MSAAKWVAEKLKAAFEFVTKLLTDPGFWVSLVVAVALAAFVIATFGTGLAVLVVAARSDRRDQRRRRARSSPTSPPARSGTRASAPRC